MPINQPHPESGRLPVQFQKKDAQGSLLGEKPQTLAVVIGTQLLIYSLAAGVCGQRALEGRSIGQICPGTLEQLQGGFDSTLKLLLALLGGAALTRMDR